MRSVLLALLATALVTQHAPAQASTSSTPGNSANTTPVPQQLTAEEREARIQARREQMLKDWPNLSRYRDADALVKQPVVAVFMGDSITELWSAKPETFFPGKPYLNRGIGGQTTPQMLLRFFQDVVQLKPNVVVINGGTNDIAGNTGPSSIEMIEHNLEAMAEIAEAHGIRVVLTSVTPAFDYPWRKGLEPAHKVVALNAWIKAFCAERRYIYADYFTPMADEKQGMKEGLSVDGIHPTAEGYKIMAPIAESAITQALQGSTTQSSKILTPHE
ncbi:SGNH/GDSL hydrolase family protein [Terriglobus sp. TAA 43]|uniref:SGNH/GDSL hydrolase family protein n=1 Tax=Terriglobus sp. TAA 43 TaxID=278961 RepID=UPI0006925290|nr:SGNH/GDSL hydrolase family protein [Terriglobus sp. TAA 43]